MRQPIRASIPTMILAFAAGFASAYDPFVGERSVDTHFNGASSVVAADFDRDGDIDLAAAARYDDLVSWWENPSGVEHVVAAGFDQAYHLVAADLDRDGWTDIVAAKRGTGTGSVTWWSNPRSAGGAWTAHNLSGSFYLDGALAVAVGDVSGDGKLDVVAAGYKNGFSDGIVMFFASPGSGGAPSACDVDLSLPVAHSVAVADLDGDNDGDILAVSYDDDVIAWYKRLGPFCAPASWTKNTITSPLLDGPVYVSAADVDGDGDLDIVAAAYASNRVLWYENTVGDGSTWVQRSPGLLGGAYDVEVVDLDRDGDLDIAAVGRTDDAVVWWEHRGTAWLKKTLSNTFDGSRSIAVFDYDADGDLDIAAAADFDDDIAWWENGATRRSATFAPRQLECSSLGALDLRDVAQLDLDFDGDADFVATAANSGAGADVIAGFVQADGSVTCEVLDADLDGAGWIKTKVRDGEPYFYVAATTSDVVRQYHSFLVGTALHINDVDYALIESPIDVEAEDLDGDRFSNPAVITTTGLSVWRAGAWVTVDSEDDGVAVAVADLDRDGDRDLAAAWGDGTVNWYANLTGLGNAWALRFQATVPGVQDLRVGDINGDGWLDLVASAPDAGEIHWFENIGPVGGVLHFDVHELQGYYLKFPERLQLVDLDRDGTLDIVATSASEGEAAWWQNRNGDGTLWIKHRIAKDLTGVQGIGIGDRDLDGYLDVMLAAAAPSRDLAYQRNRGGQVTILASSVAPMSIGDGETHALLRLVPLHRGRTSDLELELRSLNLVVDDGAGNPLSGTLFRSIVDAVEVYHDSDGSGVLEPGTDSLLNSYAAPYVASGGRINVGISHGGANPAIDTLTFQRFFLAVRMTSDATAQSTDTFRVSLVHPGLEPFHYFDYDTINARAEYFAPIVTSPIMVSNGIFIDGFESGSTSRWSAEGP